MARRALVDMASLDKGVGEAVAKLDKMILDGSCTDYASYRAKCAERKGMLACRDLLITLIDEDNDD